MSSPRAAFLTCFGVIAACTAFGASPETGGHGGAGDGGAAGEGGIAASGDGAAPCVDTSADPKNCGRCGHDCLGGACVGSKCAPFVVADIDKPWYLAIDETSVFVTSLTGSVGLTRVDKDGGARARLGSSTKGFGLSLSPTSVYLCDPERQRIFRVEKAGGGEVAVSSGECNECVYRDAQLYVGRPAASRVERLDENGANLVILAARAGGGPEGLVVDGTRVFFAWHDLGEVASVGRDGGAVVTIDEGVRPRRLAIDESVVYWVDYGSNKLHRVAKVGGDAETFAKSPVDNGPGGIAVDATHVYWVVSVAQTGALLRAPKAGGDPETLVANLDKPIEVALDGDAIYLTVEGAGHLLRLAKP